MKKLHTETKQHGFFDLGLGLALFAIFSAVGYAVISTNDQKEPVEAQQIHNSDSESSLVQ